MIEDQVLDVCLFKREARLTMQRESVNHDDRQFFYSQLGKSIAEGADIELINGDTSTIDLASLQATFDWIRE